MNSFAFGASASFSLSVLLLAGSVAQAEDAKNAYKSQLELVEKNVDAG